MPSPYISQAPHMPIQLSVQVVSREHLLRHHQPNPAENHRHRHSNPPRPLVHHLPFPTLRWYGHHQPARRTCALSSTAEDRVIPSTYVIRTLVAPVVDSDALPVAEALHLVAFPIVPLALLGAVLGHVAQRASTESPCSSIAGDVGRFPVRAGRSGALCDGSGVSLPQRPDRILQHLLLCRELARHPITLKCDPLHLVPRRVELAALVTDNELQAGHIASENW